MRFCGIHAAGGRDAVPGASGSSLVLRHAEIHGMVLREGAKYLVHYEQSIPALGTMR
jgi:hypothetical protein